MNIYLTIFPGGKQPVYRKRDIPRGDKQLPQKNDKADHSAYDEIYGYDPNGKREAAACRRDKPQEHPPDTKRNPTEKSHKKIVDFSVFDKKEICLK